jgi:hypothetical protein
MSESDPPKRRQASRPRGRGLRRGYYMPAQNRVIFRMGPMIVDVIELDQLNQQTAMAAMVEGLILTYLRGATVTEILSGAAFPNRDQPEDVLPYRSGRSHPRSWQQAIINVRVREMVAAHQAIGAKVDRQTRQMFIDHATDWVRRLNKAQLAMCKTSSEVTTEMAAILGRSPETLEELLTGNKLDPQANSVTQAP